MPAYFNESALKNKIKGLFRDRWLISLLLSAIALRLFSLQADWVERGYTHGIYPVISAAQRLLLGWIPFSVGDILYLTAGLYLLAKLVKLVRIMLRRQLQSYLSFRLLRKIIMIALAVYLVFNLSWGLNYNRREIARRFDLEVGRYSTGDLALLATLLTQRVNTEASRMDTAARKYGDRKLFDLGVQSFRQAEAEHIFYQYRYPSIKPSLFTHVGQYFGFTGYYNPFTGEAQLKTTVPVFVKPFIITHEIAHQAGYAKENEANFVSYLVCRRSPEWFFRYSIYFEMSQYALRELRRRDSLLADSLREQWHPRVKMDHAEMLAYLERSRNRIEPLFTRFYDQYLKLNRQPKGTRTYNEVVAWMIAYMRKYGREAI